MDAVPVSNVDSEESAFILDNSASTAPTTPEGSLSFSPVLRAAADQNGLDIEATSLASRSLNSRSLSSTLLGAAIAPASVRNICCVGAGYVGKFLSLN